MAECQFRDVSFEKKNVALTDFSDNLEDVVFSWHRNILNYQGGMVLRIP